MVVSNQGDSDDQKGQKPALESAMVTVEVEERVRGRCDQGRVEVFIPRSMRPKAVNKPWQRRHFNFKVSLSICSIPIPIPVRPR